MKYSFPKDKSEIYGNNSSYIQALVLQEKFHPLLIFFFKINSLSLQVLGKSMNNNKKNAEK